MQKLLVRIVLGGIAAATLTAPVSASICFEPRAPSTMFLRKPTKPYCAQSRSCEQWEVDSYKSEVRRYYQQLDEYASSVNKFQKQAAEYVQCMADLD